MRRLYDYLKTRMIQYPDKRITCGEQSVSYYELLEYSEKHSNLLKYNKYALNCSNAIETIKALFTCFCANKTAILLSKRYGQVHCQKVISKTRPNAIINDGLSIVPNHMNLIDKIYDSMILREVQLLMCTSGTTQNLPKASMITHKNLICNLKSIEDYFKISARDRVLIIRPLYHCAVLTGELLISLALGIDVYIYDDDFDPYKIIDLINENGITTIGATPSLIYQLSRVIRKKSPKTTLKNIVLSGEILGVNVYRELSVSFPNTKIYSVYGLTEASPRVLYLPPSEFNENYNTVGIPVKNCRVKLIKDELCVHSPSVMKGYYRDFRLTNKTIRKGWLYTGDIACMNSNGYIEIKGRKDDMIIKNGINIYPFEIVNALLEDENIYEVYACGVCDSENKTRIHIKLVCKYKTKKDVFDSCKKHLPKYQYPDNIEIVDVLPKNASGKMIIV